MLRHLAKQRMEWETPANFKNEDEAVAKAPEMDGEGSVSSGSQLTGGTGTSGTQRPIVGRLTDDRISRLDKLGFVWSLRDDWQKHYEELKEYKKEHGHW